MISLGDRVPVDHPLRVVRALVNRTLIELAPRFDTKYSQAGRPSIPPEQLLRALLLQVLYTVRSEHRYSRLEDAYSYGGESDCMDALVARYARRHWSGGTP